MEAAKFTQYDIIGPPAIPDGLLMSIDSMLATNISWTFEAQSTKCITQYSGLPPDTVHVNIPENLTEYSYGLFANVNRFTGVFF